MSYNEPTTPTLADIAAGDDVNYGGKTYQVASVGTVTNHNDGRITAAVTLNDANSTTITLDTKNTVLSAFQKDPIGSAKHAIWSQSAQA